MHFNIASNFSVSLPGKCAKDGTQLPPAEQLTDLLAACLCLRWYKSPDGKKLNTFAHNERALGADKANSVIATTHKHWQDLVNAQQVPDDLWVRE